MVPTAAVLERIIIGSRASFQKAFDAMAVSVPEAPKFKVVALLRPRAPGEDTDKADIMAALKAAELMGFLQGLVTSYGETLFDSTVDPSTAVAVMATQDAASKATVAVTFQAILNKEPTRIPREVSDGLAKAQRRTCKVIVTQPEGGQETGTGFLIGPRLVLTCWHVIRSALTERDDEALTPDARWSMNADAGSRIKLEFDFVARAEQGKLVCRLSRDWLVYASAADSSEHKLPKDGGHWPTGADLETYTDFAILELDQAPGLDRGYYYLRDTDDPPPKAEGNMVILHHPAQFSMRLSPGEFNDNPAVSAQFGSIGTSATRGLHTANTIGGSSGGLCLNYAMQAVALHQAGLEARPIQIEGQDTTEARINVAIPLSVVWKKAGRAISERIGGFTAARILLSDGRAMIGRFRLQQLIREAEVGRYNLLVITTGFDESGRLLSKVGKSFSTDILKDMLPKSGHLLLTYSAREFKGDVRQTAYDLLYRISPGAAEEMRRTLSLDEQSTQLNDLVVPLVNHVATKLAALTENNTIVWLIIDELDKEREPREHPTTAMFFEKLYPAIAAHRSLRLVLIGLVEQQSAILSPIPNKETETIEELNERELGSWVGLRLDSVQVLHDQTKTSLAKIICKLADQRRAANNESPSVAIARVVNDVFEPELPK